ncbi:MAG: vancomycin resistance protein [Ruminococcaceae bacterium]|nr:vancomycin resistance protein [Oscillospiraceae bacterium]
MSVWKGQAIRAVSDLFHPSPFCTVKQEEKLPALICRHKSLIRRTLGEVDPRLQENKAVNLGIAAPKVSGVLIRPGECFSFWRLVGSCTVKKGYLEGLTINRGKTGTDIGGGMCQFTNLIHWLVLHTPLRITEHHHHDSIDLFPDFGRQVPFGVGTSVFYNYLDYRFVNMTSRTYQLITYTDDTYLCGEMRADRPPDKKYHIKTEGEFFSREPDGVYRNGRVLRECVDIKTGMVIGKELIKENHAKVLYDTEGLETVRI